MSRFSKKWWLRISYRKRNAHSLVEMVLVIALGSIVLGATLAGMASLNKLDRRLSGQTQLDRIPARLVESLRTDGHAASRYAWDEQQQRLTYEMPSGSQVRYEIAEQQCIRTSNNGAQTQTFRLQKTKEATRKKIAWEVTPPTGQASDLLQITISRSTADETLPEQRIGDEGPGVVAMQILVACGRDALLRSVVTKGGTQ